MHSVVKAIAMLMVGLCASLFAQNQDGHLYKASLVQAAPGKLLALIDLYKPLVASNATGQPLWMRHSQGDHWDLLILFPLTATGSYRTALSDVERKAGKDGLIAWQEDTFVFGPPLAEVKKRFATAGFFHVEMFEALPGKSDELYREREMENDYLRRLNAPDNLIFTRDAGGAWDLFTIGFYRDLKAYAEAADRPVAEQNAAAKAAGFDAPSQIGPYLRTLIRTHHDTLATAIK